MGRMTSHIYEMENIKCLKPPTRRGFHGNIMVIGICILCLRYDTEIFGDNGRESYHQYGGINMGIRG